MSSSAARRVAVMMVMAFALSQSPRVLAQEPAARPTLDQKVAGLQRIEGFVPLWWDSARGALLMEVRRLDVDFLYQVSLGTGLGSNPVGLDRGMLVSTHIVRFERVGPRVFLVEQNTGYRALGAPPAEQRAVDESFARSILWGFAIDAEEPGRLLVDATAFVLRDAADTALRLAEAQQGAYALDATRSAVYLPATKGFPKNTELEATLTFATPSRGGSLVAGVAPSASAVTLRQHHSFVELPGPGFTPRAFDPRIGSLFVSFYDYASKITEPIEKRWVVRHRLIKRDPDAAMSEPVEPIVYYVDNGTPEPIRSALVEGAGWWNQAFEAAGFRNAFQVRVLPDGADPMDIRYNMIRWVHRSTRGWAYGLSVVDPRTGEIIKGNVTLDSQRARQDVLLGSGLDPQYAGACAMADGPDASYLVDPQGGATAEQMALARIRQLSAHEVGHAIGLAHNFAASTRNRASVMDYPAPKVKIVEGHIDLSDAYATGIGEYDRTAIAYGYRQFAPGANERTELDRLVSEAIAGGMRFLSDEEARPASAADPRASLWDNGDDAVANLRHEMKVRRLAMDRFGVASIADGQPLSQLEALFLPLYFHHRYHLLAAVKTVGGAHFAFSLRKGERVSPAPAIEMIPADRQRDALAAVLDALDPAELEVPERVVALVPPVAYGTDSVVREAFPKRTQPLFDPAGAAAIAADMVVRGLLEPHRAARVVAFHTRDARQPSFAEVVDGMVERAFARPAGETAGRALVRLEIQRVVADGLMQLSGDVSASPAVRAIATDALRRLSRRLASPAPVTDGVFRRSLRDDIERFLARPFEPQKPTERLPVPQGDPIGGN
jgi:hypothetical protein